MTFIWLVVLLIVVILIFKIKIPSWRTGALISTIYLSILIVSVPVCYLLSADSFHTVVWDRSLDQTKMQVYNNLESYAEQGKLDQLSGLICTDIHSFNFPGNTLSLKVDDPSRVSTIFIVRKTLDDGIIDVSTYTTGSTINGTDFTDLAGPPKLSLQADVLTVESGLNKNINIRKFEKDFTVVQFTKQMNEFTGNGIDFGDTILYIQVPKNLEIQQGNNYNVKIFENNKQ